MEWYSRRLGGHAHGIVTKPLQKNFERVTFCLSKTGPWEGQTSTKNFEKGQISSKFTEVVYYHLFFLCVDVVNSSGFWIKAMTITMTYSFLSNMLSAKQCCT